MMKKLFLVALVAISASAASAQQVLSVSVANPSATVRSDQPVIIPLASYGEVRRAIVTCDGKEIPCQMDDLDQDEVFDELCFLADLKGKEKKTYEVQLITDLEQEPAKYPARVFAEMLMRNDKVKEKNKHNNFIEAITVRGDCAYSYNLQHHHGVDFESELNGIRIYFDKRQTLDLYGKFQKRLELEATQFYTSQQQKAEGYGDDVLWVGNTFGLGAFRGWDGSQPTMIDPVSSRTQRIISYGPLRTIVEVIDKGWKAAADKPALNITIRYIQYAGHRDTDVEVYFTKKHVSPQDYRFSTGIINVKGSEEFSDKKGLRGCWGSDFPTGDTINTKRETVGLGILIPKQNIISEQPANKDNYAFVIAASGDVLKYKVTYTSDNETFGFHSAKSWFDYLKLWRKEVEQPVKVTVASR
ncbi:MAG: DUF4861 domain-containing protein [Prevotella sp.]|nr:DUF4861 domain-containing protein [Prevotella sp.]